MDSIKPHQESDDGRLSTSLLMLEPHGSHLCYLAVVICTVVPTPLAKKGCHDRAALPTRNFFRLRFACDLLGFVSSSASGWPVVGV